LVEGFAGQSLAEPFIQYTCAWDLRQVPNLDAMPVVGLMEMSLRQRSGNRLAVVVSASYKTGHKRQELPGLTTRILVEKLPDAS
jgi:hypothetical protein